MSKRIDIYKLRLGKDASEVYQREDAGEAVQFRLRQRRSKHPLRLMGTANTRKVYIAEEDRETNFHIIGGSRMGKSRYIEYHIRRDIDMGFGLCLLDPSDYGATFQAVLKYCAKINHPKVCIIDPAMLYDYGSVACIQPLDHKYPAKSVGGMMDTVNILFDSSNANTPRIKLNFTALLRMLAAQRLTMYEATYFADYDDTRWQPILNAATGSDAATVKEKFKTSATWRNEFGTTITRVKAFSYEPLSLMLAANKGIDFVKMVEEGWVILVNLFPEPYLSDETSQLLGILLISQIIQAVDTLKDKGGWKKRFYLYIDEAGTFATPQIKKVLDNKSKSGLNLIFAHHNFDQFTNKQVLASIKHNTGTKIMFNMRDADERLQMMKMLGFSGEISPADAAHKYRNLPRRHMLVKVNQEAAVEAITPPIDDTYVPPADFETYIRERMQDPWYLPKYEIEQQIASRIKQPINVTTTAPATAAPGDTPPPEQGTVPDSQAAQRPPKAKRGTLLDLGPDAEKFIRDNKVAEGNGSSLQGGKGEEGKEEA